MMYIILYQLIQSAEEANQKEDFFYQSGDVNLPEAEPEEEQISENVREIRSGTLSDPQFNQLRRKLRDRALFQRPDRYGCVACIATRDEAQKFIEAMEIGQADQWRQGTEEQMPSLMENET